MSLSILLPSIRPNLVDRVYKSIMENFHYNFEVVIVGPSKEGFTKWDNVKYIFSKRNPTACMQIALWNSTKRFVTYFSDDSIYKNDSLQVCYDKLIAANNRKHIITCKYTEGDSPSAEMRTDQYYKIGTTCFGATYAPPDWYLLNFAVMDKSYLRWLGGFDSKLETTIYSVTDMGIRAQRDGATIELVDMVAAHSEHMPGRSGDHGPVAEAFEDNDLPLFKQIYNDPASQDRICIPYDNWNDTPEEWPRRFK